MKWTIKYDSDMGQMTSVSRNGGMCKANLLIIQNTVNLSVIPKQTQNGYATF